MREERRCWGIRARVSLDVCPRKWQLRKLAVLQLSQDKHSRHREQPRGQYNRGTKGSQSLAKIWVHMSRVTLKQKQPDVAFWKERVGRQSAAVCDMAVQGPLLWW